MFHFSGHKNTGAVLREVLSLEILLFKTQNKSICVTQCYCTKAIKNDIINLNKIHLIQNLSKKVLETN